MTFPEGVKFTEMITMLQKSGSAVLAFSGGVDSSFLLKAMKIAGIRTLAVTAVSEAVQEGEVRRASEFAKKTGIEHLIIKTGELSNESYVSNPPDRCFFCKDELFRRLRLIAEERQYDSLFDGGNADDLRDYRPGRRAAALHGVRSPLAECNFSKDEIRAMSRQLGLDAWDRPSSPCLASRFPYGQRITGEGLRRVERAEEYLRGFGVGEVRVRIHGDVARIEVKEEDMHLFLGDQRRHISETLRSLGFRFVSLDLDGYRTGSMNRVLEDGENDS